LYSERPASFFIIPGKKKEKRKRKKERKKEDVLVSVS
jgi:hypothetical protein